MSFKKAYYNLLNEFVEDLLSMTDEEIRAEAEEDGIDFATSAKECQAIFEKAKAEVAKRRGP